MKPHPTVPKGRRVCLFVGGEQVLLDSEIVRNGAFPCIIDGDDDFTPAVIGVLTEEIAFDPGDVVLADRYFRKFFLQKGLSTGPEGIDTNRK